MPDQSHVDDPSLLLASSPSGGSDRSGTSDPKNDSQEAPVAGVPPSEVLRETFLFVLDSGDAEAFRRIGEVVQERLLDRVTYQERNPHVSFTLAEMFAAAVDLRFLEKFLVGVASERRLSDLTPTEQALSALAEELAPDVAALAEKLERRTEQLISDDQDEPPQAEG